MKISGIKKSINTFFLLFIHICLFANAAQPGLWQAGGTGGFTLLFEEDSAFYKRIQMQKERVSIQLHKGYAVVKGEYWMYNHSDEEIEMNAGYPINASYATHKNSSDLTQIMFDEMYGLQVHIDNEEKEFKELELLNDNKELDIDNFGESKWYVWENKFKPKGITKIEVRFILNTNSASVREGYDGKNYNGFIYVLETGATWKPPIGQGEIIIQLMDGLNKKDIQGVSSTFNYKYDKNLKIIHTSFENLEPSHEDNIAITYADRLEDFNFSEVLNKRDQLFESINDLSKTKINSDSEAIAFDSPFDIPNTSSYVFGGIFLFIILGVAFSILLILFILFKGIQKIRK